MIQKKNITFLLAIFANIAIFHSNKPANAFSIVQDQFDGSYYQILYHSPIGQSFTAVDPFFVSFGFYILDGNETFAPNDFDLSVSIYEGIGTNGNLLATSTRSDLTPGFRGFLDFYFGRIAQTVGNVYTAIIENETPRWFIGRNQHSYEDGTPISIDYVGGDFILYGTEVPVLDATFRVASVPEPFTVLGTTTAVSFGLFFKKNLFKSKTEKKNK